MRALPKFVTNVSLFYGQLSLFLRESALKQRACSWGRFASLRVLLEHLRLRRRRQPTAVSAGASSFAGSSSSAARARTGVITKIRGRILFFKLSQPLVGQPHQPNRRKAGPFV